MSKYIGIFWFYGEYIIGCKVPAEKLSSSSVDIIDSPFEHIKEWEGKQIYLPDFRELADTEYQQLPRGRVVYDCKHKQFIVYLDYVLRKKMFREKIIDFFQLYNEQVSWRKAPHYQTF